MVIADQFCRVFLVKTIAPFSHIYGASHGQNSRIPDPNRQIHICGSHHSLCAAKEQPQKPQKQRGATCQGMYLTGSDSFVPESKYRQKTDQTMRQANWHQNTEAGQRECVYSPQVVASGSFTRKMRSSTRLALRQPASFAAQFGTAASGLAPQIDNSPPGDQESAHPPRIAPAPLFGLRERVAERPYNGEQQNAYRRGPPGRNPGCRRSR